MLEKKMTALGLGTLALLIGCLGSCRVVESDVAQPRPDSLGALLNSPIHGNADPGPRQAAGAADSNTTQVEPASTPRIGGDDLVSLSFRQTPLPEAIQLIAESTAINIYVDTGVTGVVDASFPAVRIDDALSVILSQNGLALREDPPGIFWVEVADGSEVSTQHYKLRSINAADVAEKVTSLATGDTTIVVDENQNLVVVRGPRTDQELIGEYLRAADQLKRQVLVEVSLFEVSMNENFEFGLSHAFSGTVDGNAVTIMQSLLTPGDSFSLTFDDDGGNLSSLVEALRGYVSLELISSPRVMAVTNTQSVIEITEEVPYINLTSTNDAGGGSSVVAEVVFKEVGVKLTVQPTIQEGGVLQIIVDQELSEVVDFFNDVPVVDARHLSSQFLVNDRQTIVLGGMMQDRQRNVDTGVPVLMHIPLLGRLFRSDEDVTEKRELLVFLTPRILDPEEAAQLAGEFQNEYREKRGEARMSSEESGD